MKLLVFLFCLFCLGSSYKILFIEPLPGPSHWMFLTRFADELLKRGHELTVVTPFAKATGPHPNYTEIRMDPVYDFSASFGKSEVLDMKFRDDYNALKAYWRLGLKTTEFALNDKKIKKLIEMKERPFDLFIMEQIFAESFLMFGHKFNIPTVTLSTLPNSNHIDEIMGLITPWSNSPHFILPFDDNMTFAERCQNTLLSLYDLYYRHTYYLPKQQAIAEKHFAKHIEGPFPNIKDLEKQVSLIVVNSHRATDSPRPTITGLLNAGGAHIQKPKPLPEDLKKFIDSAEHGVIYFSLGSWMKSSDMPVHKRDIIVKALGQLKQKVIWKYEDDSIKNLPKNIMIKKWMPQNDILSHKNVLAFITHGGRFGTLEGTYWGKTMLCIPLFGDQNTNVERLKKQGIALSLDFLSFTSEEIVSKINTLISKPYLEKAKEISAIFQDNPIDPMEEAIYWIEYVVRHNGAKHLKSKAVNLNAFQYLLLDVFLYYIGFLVLGLIVIYFVVKFLVKNIFSRKVENLSKKSL